MKELFFQEVTNVRVLLVAMIVGLAAGGCRAPRGPSVKSVPESTAVPDATLGPGDVFDIRVYGEEQLSNTFRTASDGSIDYPLLGTLIVEGLTPTEVSHLVENGLREREFIKNPQVSVFVKEYKSKKVSVLGQVKKPGTFGFEEGMSVVEAISIAGGFTSMARENDTTVTRIVDGGERRYHVPVGTISQGRHANFFLQPGDIIFVPERIF